MKRDLTTPENLTRQSAREIFALDNNSNDITEI
jgi:hypothetical protein